MIVFVLAACGSLTGPPQLRLVPTEPGEVQPPSPLDTGSVDTDLPDDTDRVDTDTPTDTGTPEPPSTHPPEHPVDTDPPVDPHPPEPHGHTDPPEDTGSPTGCPADMVAIESICIDRYEAHLEGADPFQVPNGGIAANAAGAVPQGYISGEVAAAACSAAGKRLCSASEWTRACEGPAGTTYPYGNSYDPSACNVARSSHPIVELFGSGATWSGSEMNDPQLNQLPDSLAASGTHPECVTPEGVHDLHGNLHEWIADPAGTFKGGFYVDAVINGAGCSYTTTAHTFGYHDYSTGFRCCADPN